ncbi:MAG TPA: archaemetzincin family Zn-dependent metalloprotease [Pyrinomonadaceae bacterium]|nr:archaemetzincin family Zn-dependent metalloprotease [Pyrinomonadaceae bacterium]
MTTNSNVSQIILIAVGAVDPGLLEYLMFMLPGRFDTECVCLDANITFQETYSGSRKQFHATQLLAKLHELAPADGRKLLGITDLDLFIPIFTFVFGAAQVGGCAALMSTHRLHQEFYGLPGDGQLLLARAEKEAIHELGHTHGLAHCRGMDCVMRFSNSVEQVDLRTCNFCQLCETRWRDRSASTLAA